MVDCAIQAILERNVSIVTIEAEQGLINLWIKRQGNIDQHTSWIIYGFEVMNCIWI